MIRRRGRRIRRRESTNCQVQFVKIHRIVGMGDFWCLDVRRSRCFRHKLLNGPQVFRVYCRQVQLVLQSTANGVVKPVPEADDFVDVRPGSATSFVEGAFEFSNVGRQGVGNLFESIQLILCFLPLVRVIVYPRELFQDRVVVPDLTGFSDRQLWEDHALNGAVEIQVNIVKLRNGISNSLAVDPQLGLD